MNNYSMDDILERISEMRRYLGIEDRPYWDLETAEDYFKQDVANTLEMEKGAEEMRTVGQLSSQFNSDWIKQQADETNEMYMQRVYDFLVDVYGNSSELSRRSLERKGIDMEALLDWADKNYPMPAEAPKFTFKDLSANAKRKVRKEFIEAGRISYPDSSHTTIKTIKALGYDVGTSVRIDANILKPENRNKIYFDGAVNNRDLLKIARRLLSAREVWYIRKIIVGQVGVHISLGESFGGGQYARVEYDSHRRNGKTPKVQALMKRFESAVSSELNYLIKVSKHQMKEEVRKLHLAANLDPIITDKGEVYNEDGSKWKAPSVSHHEFSCFYEILQERNRADRKGEKYDPYVHKIRYAF